jgi:hypothetical protein
MAKEQPGTRNRQQRTPFKTSSGLQIGCMYQPQQRPVYHDPDALRLQDALVNRRRQPSGLGIAAVRLVRCFWAWC